MFKVEIGENGLNNTWQAPFPKETECCKCKANARIGFVVLEETNPEKSLSQQEFVADLHENKKGEMWLHDVCAVAVYFCKKCLSSTSLYNQA